MDWVSPLTDGDQDGVFCLEAGRNSMALQRGHDSTSFARVHEGWDVVLEAVRISCKSRARRVLGHGDRSSSN
jgi:hypothetical protein